MPRGYVWGMQMVVRKIRKRRARDRMIMGIRRDLTGEGR